MKHILKIIIFLLVLPGTGCFKKDNAPTPPPDIHPELIYGGWHACLGHGGLCDQCRKYYFYQDSSYIDTSCFNCDSVKPDIYIFPGYFYIKNNKIYWMDRYNEQIESITEIIKLNQDTFQFELFWCPYIFKRIK